MKLDAGVFDGIYWHFGWTAGGAIIVAGEWVLSYPLYGAPRELFERWREAEISIPLDVMMFELSLRDSRGIAVRRGREAWMAIDRGTGDGESE